MPKLHSTTITYFKSDEDCLPSPSNTHRQTPTSLQLITTFRTLPTSTTCPQSSSYVLPEVEIVIVVNNSPTYTSKCLQYTKTVILYYMSRFFFILLTDKEVREVTKGITYFLACPSILLIPHMNPDQLAKQSAMIHHKTGNKGRH